ncbi:MAG: Yip1 family protein [Ktedonobacteraceae bacterium]
MLTDSGPDHSSNGHGPKDHNKSDKRARPRATYPTWSSDLGFVPQAQPLPWRVAWRQLPRHYRFVLTKPGFEPFLAEMGRGEWKVVWAQLLAYSMVAAVLAFVRNLLYPATLSTSSSASGLSSVAVLQVLGVSTSLGLLVLIPLGFFCTMGLLYWLARLFGGHGIFVQQVYTTLLFLVPCGVSVSVLGLLPFVGSFLSTFLGFGLFVYGAALQCFATLAVHQLSGGKATAAVILTLLILFAAGIAGLFILTSLLTVFL